MRGTRPARRGTLGNNFRGAAGGAATPAVSRPVSRRKGKEKGSVAANQLTLQNNGRDGGIRTRDPLHPMQVRYQAALRPD
jgi:hypothetical protein